MRISGSLRAAQMEALLAVMLMISAASEQRLRDGVPISNEDTVFGQWNIKTPIFQPCPSGNRTFCGALAISQSKFDLQLRKSLLIPQIGSQVFFEGFVNGAASPTASIVASQVKSTVMGQSISNYHLRRGILALSNGSIYELRSNKDYIETSVILRDQNLDDNHFDGRKHTHDHRHDTGIHRETLSGMSPPHSTSRGNHSPCITVEGDWGLSEPSDIHKARTAHKYRRTHTDSQLLSNPKARHNTGNVVCNIFLDGDSSFFEKWGGTGSHEEQIEQAKLKMADTIFFADALMSLPRNLGGSLRFRVAGMKIHEQRSFRATSSSNVDAAVQVLALYQRALARDYALVELGQTPSFRSTGNPTSAHVCLNHYFTHQNFDGALGVAYEASSSLNSYAGLCESNIRSGRAMNVGLTSTMTFDGSTVPLWKTYLSTTHELGHNLGGTHDCAVQSHPTINSSGGAFLMFPEIGLVQQTESNNQLLSACSKTKILGVVEAKGWCLTPLDQTLCSANSPCCSGEVPIHDGAECMQSHDGFRGWCDAGTCQATNAACALSAGEAPCMTACDGSPEYCTVRLSFNRSICSIVRAGNGYCSQPCGLGVWADLYTCSCSDGETSGCGGAQSYSSLSECFIEECDRFAPHDVIIAVNKNVADLDDAELETALMEATGRQILILKLIFQQGSAITFAVLRSCRLFSNTTDCVNAASLKAVLSSATVSSQITLRTGIRYSVEEGTRAQHGFEPQWLSDQLVVACCCFAVIGGIAIGIAFQCGQPDPQPVRLKTSSSSKSRYQSENLPKSNESRKAKPQSPSLRASPRPVTKTVADKSIVTPIIEVQSELTFEDQCSASESDHHIAEPPEPQPSTAADTSEGLEWDGQDIIDRQWSDSTKNLFVDDSDGAASEVSSHSTIVLGDTSMFQSSTI